MIRGEKIAECRECYSLEEKGGISDRLQANREYFSESTLDINKIQSQGYQMAGPEVLDLRVGNVCNLKCQSCFPDLSVGVYDDVRALHLKAPSLFKRIDSPRALEPGFELSQVQNHLSALRVLKIIGGEPLLSQSAKELLSYCVQSGEAKHIDLQFHTNLTLWRPEFFSLVTEFKSALIHFSMDGYGPMNEYLRHPSDWEACASNLKKSINFFAQNPNVRLGMSPVVQATNILHFPILLNYWLEDLRLPEKGVILSPIFLASPEYYSPFILSDQIRNTAVDQLTQYFSGLTMEQQNYLSEFYTEFLNLKNGAEDKALLKKYVGVTEQYDQMRGTSILEVFPEFLTLKNSLG